MKCVVLGGGGFIGSAICDRLLQDGHKVRIFERPRVQYYREFDWGELVEWVSGDFENPYDLMMAIKGMDVVFHLVSSTLPKTSNDDMPYDVRTNLLPTLKLLDLMVHAKIKKIIFISSGGTIYGKTEYLPIDECHPTNPLVSYGITKLAIEKYLLMYKEIYGMRPIILRVANPYGARQKTGEAQGAVSVFLNNALNDSPINIWGDGEVVRDYIYISDVADACIKALDYQGNKTIFNIGTSIGTSLNQLVSIFENLLGRRVVLNYLPSRAIDVPANILCNNLAEMELKWRHKVPLQNGIRKMMECLEYDMDLAHH